MLLTELEGHTDGIWSISATPDGKRFVSGSLDKRIRIWDRNDSGIWQQSGEFLRADWVWSVAISQDGTRIVASSEDNIVMVYDQDINTHTWDSSQLWKGGQYAMINEPEVAMAYDGKLIVSGANNSLIFVWNKNSNGQWKHVKLSWLRGNKLAIAADEQRIVCSSDGEITVWDREPIDEFCQRQNRLKVIEHLERILLPSWVFDKP